MAEPLSPTSWFARIREEEGQFDLTLPQNLRRREVSYLCRLAKSQPLSVALTPPSFPRAWGEPGSCLKEVGKVGLLEAFLTHSQWLVSVFPLIPKRQ